MKWIRELLPYIIIIIVVVFIRTFFITPVRVDGPSMNPTLANGQILLLNKTAKSFNRMDIVVFKYKKEKLIKRVIGLPGDHVKITNNKLYINDKEVEDYSNSVKTADFDLTELGVNTIPEGYYFVMGDNRYDSTDSRIIGLISQKQITGRIVYRFFPFDKFGVITS